MTLWIPPWARMRGRGVSFGFQYQGGLQFTRTWYASRNNEISSKKKSRNNEKEVSLVVANGVE